MKPLLTYGEAYYKVKESLHMENGEFKAIRLPSHIPKMKRNDAAKYYTQKINAAFYKIGMKRKKIVSEFEKDLPGSIKNVQHKTKLMLLREATKIVNELAA